MKALNTVLSQLPALFPSLSSPPDSTGPNLLTSDLQNAMEGLCKMLQDTHVSFLFDGSTTSSANEVQLLQFPPLSNIPNLDTLDNDEDSTLVDKMMKVELCAMIMSLKQEMKQVKKFSRNLIQDHTTSISQLSLVHAEHKKL